MADETDNLTLAELMQDPLIQLMMRSDGVDQTSISALFVHIAQSRRLAVWPQCGCPRSQSYTLFR